MENQFKLLLGFLSNYYKLSVIVPLPKETDGLIIERLFDLMSGRNQHRSVFSWRTDLRGRPPASRIEARDRNATVADIAKPWSVPDCSWQFHRDHLAQIGCAPEPSVLDLAQHFAGGARSRKRTWMRIQTITKCQLFAHHGNVSQFFIVLYLFTCYSPFRRKQRNNI